MAVTQAQRAAADALHAPEPAERRRAIDAAVRVYAWLNRPEGSEAPKYRAFIGTLPIMFDGETKEAAIAAAEAWRAEEIEREAKRRARAASIAAAARGRVSA